MVINLKWQISGIDISMYPTLERAQNVYFYYTAPRLATMELPIFIAYFLFALPLGVVNK